MKKQIYILNLLFLCPGIFGQKIKLDSLFLIANKSNKDSSVVNALVTIGRYYKEKNTDSSISYYFEAYNLAKKIKYKRGYFNALNGTAWCYHLKQNYYKSDSISNIVLNDQTVLPGNLYDCYHNLSYFRTGQGRFAEALKYQLASEKLVIQHNNYKLLVSVYNQFGNLYNAWANKEKNPKDKYQKCLFYYQAADSIAIKYHFDEYRRNVLLMNLALGYENLLQFDKAEEYYKKTFNELKDSPNQTGYALALTNYCSFKITKFKSNSNKEELTQCLSTSLMAEERAEKSGYLSLISYIKLSKSEANRLLGFYDKAITEANYLINPKENLNLVLTLEAYNTLYEIYKSKGDLKNALANLKMHYVIKDSLSQLKNNEELTSLEARYNNEQKQKENELLKANNIIALQTISQQKKINLFIIIGLIIAMGFVIMIFRSYRSKQKTNKELAIKNAQIEEQKKGILDSIHYAKRIQQAILASNNFLDTHLSDYFIYYQPKDIVSGDFYWASLLKNGGFALVTADSTGHGVPGAFMSLLNISYLNEGINERCFTDPAEILNHTRSRLIQALAEDGSSEGGKDGMDCVVCCFDFNKKMLTYSAANNSFYIVRNGEIINCSSDKMPVGKSPKENEPFTRKEIALLKGDLVYTLTDGYADQFGGPKGKKFKYKQLNDLLLSLSHLPMTEQKSKLEETFHAWKGDLEQVDDVLLIGIKI